MLYVICIFIVNKVIGCFRINLFDNDVIKILFEGDILNKGSL